MTLARWARTASFALALTAIVALNTAVTAQGSNVAYVLNAKGAITPVILSYLERGLAQAASAHAQLLIIQLDTPGGSVEIMKQLTDEIVRSTIPVVVYVGPEGARAASAGTFVVLSAHVAAMAPGTTIGAASVVSMQGQEIDETEKAKITNDLAARIRNFAQRRPPAAQAWAESAVREAVAATSDEALKLGVIDFVARDLNDLLRQMDGFSVVAAGHTLVLHTGDLAAQPLPMTFTESLLHTITDPNIAFILLTIGMNAILFELSSPGAVLPGVVGGICLVLSLYALGVLSVNYTGVLFIVLAFALFLLDIKAPTHGVLTVGGIASFVFGAMILFNSPAVAVSRPLIFSIALATGAFFAFAVSKVVGIHRKKVTTGREAMLDAVGHVRTELAPDGFVFVHGELWKAVAEGGVIPAGTRVRVVSIEGFTLNVRRADAAPTA